MVKQASVPQPQYAYHDIMTSLPALAPHIQTSDNVSINCPSLVTENSMRLN